MGARNYHGYEVSIDGTVKSKLTGRPLARYISHDGYVTHVIRINKKSVRIGLHRLIALCFINNEKAYGQVNHIDGNKRNNNVENLEWCTAKQNAEHAVINGLSSRGKICKNNTSGYVGVTYDKVNNKWMAQIKINYKLKKIGRYSSAKDASVAYWDAYNKYLGNT